MQLKVMLLKFIRHLLQMMYVIPWNQTEDDNVVGLSLFLMFSPTHSQLHLTQSHMFWPLLFYWNLYNWANIETHMLYVWSEYLYIGCRNPTLKECEDETHTPEIEAWESSGTPEISEFDCRGQNTTHWGVLYIIGKLSKCKCQKWARMGHLDICNTHYGKKKGRESNWQFNSRPLKVRNQPDLGACRWSVIHCLKALEETYKFSLNLIPIGGLNKKL